MPVSSLASTLPRFESVVVLSLRRVSLALCPWELLAREFTAMHLVREGVITSKLWWKHCHSQSSVPDAQRGSTSRG
ncbi:hypothetical protein E2C01_036698 [Portunus trituberculatus]|uniref:Uncharacterized protein n=1 Tax=Portunus trituberculatus TaxID=210409 RepID=A0A5B7F9D5_PORTR|nr:hypothetical protein [Portunus trituberculatus]